MINELMALSSTNIKYLLALKKHQKNKRVKKIYIARYLKLSRSTITYAFNKLSNNGFLLQENYYNIILTDKAIEIFKLMDYYLFLLEEIFTRKLFKDRNKALSLAENLLINKQFTLMNEIIKADKKELAVC